MPGLELPGGLAQHKWIILPAGAGALAGLFILLRSGKSSGASAPALIPVAGQQAGGVDPVLSGLNQALAALASGQQQIADTIGQGNSSVDQVTGAVSTSVAQAVGSVSQQVTAQNQALQSQVSALAGQLAGVTAPKPPAPWYASLAAAFSSAFTQQTQNVSGWADVGGSTYKDPSTGAEYFGGTGHFLSNGFQAYYNKNGGFVTYGAPVSEEFRGPGGTVEQVFQRGVFAWTPGSDPANYDVHFTPMV